MSLSIGLAFLAGLASFLSPCVFSLVPAYIGYLSGRSLALNDSSTSVTRLNTFFHGLSFVIGFSFIFIFVLGLPISALGTLLYDFSPVLSKIGGVIVILLGIHMTGLIRIPFLDYDFSHNLTLGVREATYLRRFLGCFFQQAGLPAWDRF